MGSESRAAAAVSRIFFMVSPQRWTLGGNTVGLRTRRGLPAHRAGAAPGVQRSGVQTVKLELQKELARHLRGGHPWVYRRALEKPPPGLAAGAIVDVTERGRFVARGYYDPHSHISVRAPTIDPAEALGSQFCRRRIASEAALRRAYVPIDYPALTECA